MSSNVRQLLDNGVPVYPITSKELVIGLQDAPFESYIVAWDGSSAPTVANIPAGVVVNYSDTDYTGTLAASATTAHYLYLVASASQPGEYDRYITTLSGSSYVWTPLGSTAPVSPVIADDLVTNDASKALSAKQGKVLGDKTSELEAKVDELSTDIDNSIAIKKSYTIADFMDGYRNTNPASVDIGSTFTFVNSTTPMSESSNGGQLHIEVKKGDRVTAKMKSTSNSYCMAYIFLDTNKTILSWAGKTSQSFDWRANPHTFVIEQDGYLVLQIQAADYSDNVAAPLSVVHHTVENLVGIPARVSALEEGAETMGGRLQDIEQFDEDITKDFYGTTVKSPTIISSKSIHAPEGTIETAGFFNIYTEVIQSGVKMIWTKFNSYSNPDNSGYAFYDASDNLLLCKGSLAGNDSTKNGVWMSLAVPSGAVKFSNSVAKIAGGGLVLFDYEGIRLDDGIKSVIPSIDEYLGGVFVNNPSIQTSKGITAPNGTIDSSGACNIYTEKIPSGTTRIWTKFNSYGAPNVIGYAFYGANDALLSCGPTLAGKDSTKNGVWLGLDVPSGALKFANTVAKMTAFGLIQFDYEGIKITQGLDSETKELESRVSAIEEELSGESEYSPKFHLPSRLDFIKGEKVLLFKSAMGNSIDPKNIYCKNSQCRDFPRYVEVEPVTAGESNIEFNVMDENYEKVGTKIVKLNVFEKPTNPANTVRILVVGSSTTSNYANPYEELYRRLVLETGEAGNPSNPKGLGLSNIVFVGRKVNTSGNFRYEATGGFSWNNYADPQGTNNNYAFTVENPSAYLVGDVYTDGTYDFEISEISQDDNRVSAKCATQNAPIPASGSLSLKTGTGASTLVYSAVVATITHPFDIGNGVSLEDYMDAYCGGVSPDIIVFQDLVFNNGSILTDSMKTKISTLLGIIHTEYPNAKILISSEALPASTGGLATNYKAGSAIGQTNLVAWRLRKLVTDTESFISELNEDLGGDVVMFVPKTVQCDAEYDYPATAKAVNFRVTNKTEEIGTNGMHPTASAGIYNQIDSYYRSIAYAIKKWYN